ncbi:hypothetical protein AC1031_006519 [Aphanomyces cochlioides]|nr:hypothetical protein AC1031_006519 [Aphanomyces cochlioides]
MIGSAPQRRQVLSIFNGRALEAFYAGVWIRGSEGDTSNDMQAVVLVTGVKRYANNVKAVFVRNEDLMNGVDPGFVIAKVQEMKQLLRYAGFPNIPVSSVQTDGSWGGNWRNLANNCDILGVNIHPFFSGGISRTQPIEDLKARWNEMVGWYPGKNIMLTETGWPTAGSNNDGHQPDLGMTKDYLYKVNQWARQGNGVHHLRHRAHRRHLLLQHKNQLPPPTKPPTRAPTPIPTQKPTQSPTRAPTPPPTTLKPTQAPTSPPTLKPTQAPTQSPTPSPTFTTTRTPKPFPTFTPRGTPTPSPTSDEPTPSPTSRTPKPFPTFNPSRTPKPFPTLSPSEAPTPSPTITRPDTPKPLPSYAPSNSPRPEPRQNGTFTNSNNGLPIVLAAVPRRNTVVSRLRWESKDWVYDKWALWSIQGDQIVNVANDKCLAAYEPMNGGLVRLAKCDANNHNQRWTYDATTASLDAYWLLLGFEFPHEEPSILLAVS